MTLIGAGFVFAIIGAIYDWQYIRKGGRRSNRAERLWFLFLVALVAALYGVLIYFGDSGALIGYITPTFTIVLFSVWELGRWKVRRKNPLPEP
jgi:drug/metabolite transporter (DMT)-like permease